MTKDTATGSSENDLFTVRLFIDMTIQIIITQATKDQKRYYRKKFG